MTNISHFSMTQKEENDHRQASRDNYLEVKEACLLTSHLVGTDDSSSLIYGVFVQLFQYFLATRTPQSWFRAIKLCSVILPHSLRRQHPEVSAVGGTCTGDRPANRRHNSIKNPVVSSPPLLASGPFKWAPEMRRMRGRPTCCWRC